MICRIQLRYNLFFALANGMETILFVALRDISSAQQNTEISDTRFPIHPHYPPNNRRIDTNSTNSIDFVTWICYDINVFLTIASSTNVILTDDAQIRFGGHTE